MTGGPAQPGDRRGFTLVELLVVLAVVAMLVGLLIPGLGGAREAGRLVRCGSNQRQLGAAWAMYAGDFHDRAVPLAYTSEEDLHGGTAVYWWGRAATDDLAVDHAPGFISPYLAGGLGDGTVFECPAQAWGTYTPEGATEEPTTTYGYNGYYLSPSRTPGWSQSIGHRPWRRVYEVLRPSEVMVFADAMLPGASSGQGRPLSTCLLDPPKLFGGGTGGWVRNSTPTTSFRHGAARRRPGASSAVRADGSVGTSAGLPENMVRNWPTIGAVSADPGPAYVPDWREW